MDFDLVITVCDSTAEECLVWLGKDKKMHHRFPDSVKTDDMKDFRQVRDVIMREIPKILSNFDMEAT